MEGFSDSHNALVSKLLKAFYVDDLVTGVDTEEEAFSLFSDSKSLMKRGGVNFAQTLQRRIDLIETSMHVVDSVDEEDKTYAQCTLKNPQKSSEGERKVLGVLWNVNSYEIILDFS